MKKLSNLTLISGGYSAKRILSVQDMDPAGCAAALAISYITALAVGVYFGYQKQVLPCILTIGLSTAAHCLGTAMIERDEKDA